MTLLNYSKKKCRHKGGHKFRMWAMAVFCGLAFCKSMAQDKIDIDVDHLVGSDPADIINTDNSNRETPNSDAARSKTFLLFNMGGQKFFNIGGSYGRHASLSTAGIYLWIFDNSKTSGTYNIRTHQNIQASNKDNKDSYVQYIDNDALKNGVYLDCQPTDDSRSFGWKFEKADGYDAKTNKVYKISTYGNRYLTAIPDDPEGNLCEATADSPEKTDYQTWKLITVKEYYELFDKSPSDLTTPIGATFLLQNPNFHYDKTNLAHWAATGGNSNAVRYGVEGFYKYKAGDTSYQGDKANDQKYLCENGKYFSADIKNCHNIKLVQTVAITKPGWFIIRCNGFSNTNGLAKLFVSDFLNFYYGGEKVLSSSLLNPLEANGPTNLLEAGKAFYSGKYENQVMIHVTKDDFTTLGGTNALVFGIEVDGDKNVTPTNEWTAFDNFRMLYAGDSELPDLVLDEDNPDLSYLTQTSDEYKNTVLHLNRKFTLNKWNSIILPVDLTYGQMKRTFGDDVLLAGLYKLTANSVQFKSVEASDDNTVMLHAFTPYIIKPTKEAGYNREYTTPRLRKSRNQYWLDENEGITNDQDGETRYTGGIVSIAANHYDISSITLNRDDLKKYIDQHGVSTTTMKSENEDMECKGTLVKTYYTKDNKGYFYTDEVNNNKESRDDLSGAYFMNNGNLWKVPDTKQYGLKAFRCWFRLTDLTDQDATKTSPSKDVTFWLDGTQESTTTGIDDIIADDPFAQTVAYKSTANAIYNMNGQMVRKGTSIEGLPSGIYIVKGRKIVIP